MVPIGTSHLWLLLVWIHHSSASVFPSFSSCWGAKRHRGGFLPPHHPGKSLAPADAVSAPKGSLRAGSAFFAGLLQPFVLYQQGLGVVAANINSLAFVRKIHHPVEVYLLFRCIRIPDTFFGSWRLAKFSNSWLFAWVSPRLRRSSRGSWLRFGVFSTVLDSALALSARLAHSGVLPRVDFLSLRTFLWLCNSLGIVIVWEMSQLVAHQ